MTQNGRPVQVGRGLGSERRPGLVGLAHHPHRLRGAGRGAHVRLRHVLPDEFGALGARLRVGEDHLDPVKRDLLPRDQTVPDRQVVLADQRDAAGVEGEGVEGGADRTLDGVLERDQRPIRIFLLDREDRVVDRGGRHRLDPIAPHRRAEGVLREGPPRPQIGDSHSKMTV